MKNNAYLCSATIKDIDTGAKVRSLYNGHFLCPYVTDIATAYCVNFIERS